MELCCGLYVAHHAEKEFLAFKDILNFRNSLVHCSNDSKTETEGDESLSVWKHEGWEGSDYQCIGHLSSVVVKHQDCGPF